MSAESKTVTVATAESASTAAVSGGVRSFLVTGGNDGIGFEVVKQLAEAGQQVFLGSRSLDKAHAAIQKLDEALRGRVTPVRLDINDIESVNAAVVTCTAAGGVDVLVNNAAVGGLERVKDQHPASLDLSLVRNVFETNYFGTVQVTNAFLPLLGVSSRPGVVFVSHAGGSNTLGAQAVGNPNSHLHRLMWVGYSGSKAALHSYCVQVAACFPKFKVNAVTPGYTATKLNGHGRMMAGAKSPAEGAACIVRVALREDATGKFFGDDGGLLPW